MLFIKFKIDNLSKFADFQNFFLHRIDIRQPSFKFEEEEKELQTFDWCNMNKEEADEALKKTEY